jgi:glucose-6-phosphate 1-dehydrogenase
MSGTRKRAAERGAPAAGSGDGAAAAGAPGAACAPDAHADEGCEPVNPYAAPAGPAAIVIFGASGDLTKRKLVPALYNLMRDGLLGENVAILGVARSTFDSDAFREKIAEDLRAHAGQSLDERKAQRLVRRLHYLPGDLRDDATYARLAQELARIDREHQTGGNTLFYLATAPDFFEDVAVRLGRAGLTREEGGRWRRVIVEKPFGTDLASAIALNQALRAVLDERQIYRIDHYLGKETVQNILVFRFGNGMFEPIWNRRYIDNVQITVAETVGVEGRGDYYDGAGALRDMVPNHILQLLALVAMEPPTSFGPETVREEKAKVLRAVQPLSPEGVIANAVRGQYGAGEIGGKGVPGYREEPKVAKASPTETYAALKLRIDSWRWADVPFYLRTGKRMAQRVSEIAIQFRRPPLQLFRKTPVEHLSRNVLVIRVQPEDGIVLRFGAKIPGPTLRVGDVAMDFRYKDYFGANPTTGYETLLYDCMEGDPTLFQRGDMAEIGWAIVEPVLEVWKALPPRTFPNYAAGSWGPKEADELLERDGRRWRRIEE